MSTSCNALVVPRYGAMRHRLDRWRGRRDGRRGLPSLPADMTSAGPSQEMLTTPYMLVLLQRHDAFRAKLLRAAVESPDYGSAATVANLTMPVDELTRLVAEYPAEPAAEPIDSGIASYLQMSDDDVERERRRQHLRGRRSLARELLEARAKLSAAMAVQEKTVAAARGAIDEHAAHIRERLFVYLDAVVAAHPDGSQLQWWVGQARNLTNDPLPDGGSRQLISGPYAAPAAIEPGNRPNNSPSSPDEDPNKDEDE